MTALKGRSMLKSHASPCATLLSLALAAPALAQAPVAAPASFAVADRAVVLAVHGEGAQVYQCKAGADGRLAWSLREPIAILVDADGKTIGRNFAGPSWALDDGGAVKGALLASQPGAGPNDIAVLKLAVAEHRGGGVLAAANLVLRLNTHGGALNGDCAAAGDLRAVAYSADYVFLR
jgi:hypothetical protein